MTQNISFKIKIQVDLANISHLDKKMCDQEIQKIIDSIYKNNPIIAIKNLKVCDHSFDKKNSAFCKNDKFVESTNMKIFRKKRRIKRFKKNW